eukprot:TRINITY_DN246_c4_g1_i1.p1 TRINITY_DN246_c4_g1~~TRINITY_DN246_c4_g1_i1.p1  ORF type:complete len:479 (+),score=102.68 TRINITY_DN246_c4_g1_i1:59-1438(+)
MSSHNVTKALGRSMRAIHAERAKKIPEAFTNVVTEVKPIGNGKHANCYGKSSDLTLREASGCYVTATNGETYLDVTSGIAVLSTGHCHPRVVEAVREQAGKCLHAQLNCFQSHTQLDELVQKLDRITPDNIDTFFPDTTGSQAIEAAVKMCRRHTGRQNIICIQGGFHGRTTLTSAMTSSNAGARYPSSTPLPSGVYHTQAPMAFRWGVSEEEACDRAIQQFKDMFRSHIPADSVAAIVMEPILGEGGCIPIPGKFWAAVRSFCDEHGALLVADEIQCGVARSGTMWASDQLPGNPDVIVTAKGLASGMPLSMVCSSSEIMDSFTPGTHGGTYMGNIVACAAANATLDIIEDEDLCGNAKRQGDLLHGMLTDVFKKNLPACDVRGKGLMRAIEVRDLDGNASPEIAQKIRKHCLDNSNVLLYAPSGWDANAIRLIPSLTIQEHETVHLASAIEAAVMAI